MRICLLITLYLLTNTCFGQQREKICSKQKSGPRFTKTGLLSSFDTERIKQYDLHYANFYLSATNTSSYISGNVNLHASCMNLDTMVLELHENFYIDSILVNQEKTNFDRRKNTLCIPINQLTKFQTSIYYHGTAPSYTSNPLGGSGLSTAIDKNTNTAITYTLSEPFSAYEWWPCKQDLNDKIDSIDLHITIPSICKVGSNGLLTEISVNSNESNTYHWKHRYPIVYYLISMSIAPYIDYSFKVKPSYSPDSILIQNYIYNTPETLRDSKNEILKTGDYLCYFSDLFGLYPFHKEKYGHCLATLSGGMEHQTMTTLISFENQLVAHELAHQWWGDHVTCSSWSDIWLNEGFATYSEYLMLGKFDIQKQQSKLNGFHDNILSEKDGSVFCLDTLNKTRIFSRRLTYNKGAAIIHTLRYIINNDSLFFGALRDFQQKYSFRSASTKDFKKSIEQFTNTSLDSFFNEWYYGEGYPTYSAKLENESLYITHETSTSTTELFSTPLEIAFSRYNLSDTIIRFEINKKKETIAISHSLKLKEIIAIDPNNYIINQVALYPFAIDSLEMNALIFPNPASNQLNIIQKNAGKYEVKLIDNTGKKLHSANFLKEILIDTNLYPESNYTIEVRNEETNSFYKKQITIVNKK
ncbi:MAG: hypothetical protein KA264_06705 [Crocinitomicaceae bacterium]|nr:hypothetical protein [Crocinitomicaceae bacterium]